MSTYSDQDVFRAQFVDLLREISPGVYYKPYGGAPIKVSFLTSLDPGDTVLAQNYEDHLSKNSSGQYIFSAMTPEQRDKAKAAFEAISKVTGLTFEFTTDNNSAQIRLGVANTKDKDTVGPNGERQIGKKYGGINIPWGVDGNRRNDIFIHSEYDLSYGFGQYGYTTLLHEIGHAVGLVHLSENSNGTVSPYNSRAVSVMSYADLLEVPGGPGVHKGNYGSTPLILDVLALQMLYGTRSHKSENTHYIFSPITLTTGEKNTVVANLDNTFYKGRSQT